MKVPCGAEFFISRFGIMAQSVEVAPNIIQETMAACSNLLYSVVGHIMAAHIIC